MEHNDVSVNKDDALDEGDDEEKEQKPKPRSCLKRTMHLSRDEKLNDAKSRKHKCWKSWGWGPANNG